MNSSRSLTAAAAGLAACAVAFGAAAGGASSKTPPPSGSYKGKTSKGFTVSFKVKGGKVTAFSAAVDALCVSVLDPSPARFDILHFITPPPMKLSSGGTFKGEYKIDTSSTHAKIDGKVTGTSASGHYSLAYSKLGGVTSLGVTIIYACQDQGTWKASLKK
jgi:hypothetical protein